jgi:hypothetical protein
MQFSAVLFDGTKDTFWDLEISGKAKTNNAGKSRGVTKRKRMCQEG